MKKRSITIVLLVTILLQSCVVYQPAPVILNQAHDKGKGKLIRDNGEEIKFKNIEFSDSVYYVKYRARIKNIEGEYHWNNYLVPITSENVSVIFLKDRKKSGLRTAGLIVGVSVGIVVFTIVIIETFYIVE